MSWENLIKDQSIFSYVIILLILIASFHDNVRISLGGNCCWSPLGLKGLNPSAETPSLSPCYSSDHFLFCLWHLHWTLSQYQQSLLWTQWKVHCKETYNLISRWKSSCKLFSLLGVDVADVFGLTPSSSWSLVTVTSILSSQSSSWAICSSFRFMPGYVAKENHVI